MEASTALGPTAPQKAMLGVDDTQRGRARLHMKELADLGAARHPVGARPARTDVVAVLPVQQVIPRFAKQRVISVAAADLVVAVTALQAVAAVVAAESIVARQAADHIVAAQADD